MTRSVEGNGRDLLRSTSSFDGTAVFKSTLKSEFYVDRSFKVDKAAVDFVDPTPFLST